MLGSLIVICAATAAAMNPPADAVLLAQRRNQAPVIALPAIHRMMLEHQMMTGAGMRGE